MELAIYVERIPTLTADGDHLCCVVEISETEAALLLETLRLCMVKSPDPQPIP